MTGDRLAELFSSPSDLGSLAFSPDGHILASEGQKGHIILWDMKTRQQLGEPLEGYTDLVSSLAFSPNGKILASTGHDGNIILRNISEKLTPGKLLFSHEQSTYLAYSPNGQILASADQDSHISLWNVETKQRLYKPLSHKGPLWNLVFSPDGQTLASGGESGEIFLWDVKTGQQLNEPLNRYDGHGAFPVLKMMFSPDGHFLISNHAGLGLGLWDIKTRKKLVLQNLKSQQQLDDVFNRDGHSVLNLPEIKRTIGLVNTHPRSNIYINSDGRTLIATSGFFKNVELDTSGGSPLEVEKLIIHHDSPVLSTTFSPDGKILASSFKDGQIILWDTETRQPVEGILIKNTQPVWGIIFSPDGKTLASASQEGIILWDVNPNSWEAKICHKLTPECVKHSETIWNRKLV